MKICEYFMPCGRCDKFNKSCDLTVKDLENYQIMMGDTTPETKSECEHEWRYGIQSATGHHYICTKCGTMKIVPLENLSYTDKECDHDWYFDSHIISMGVEKEKYVCNKCGKVKWTDGIWLK